MAGKKFFIYLDILGFEDLPGDIAEKTKFNENVIREKFLSEPLKEKIDKIEKIGVDYRHGISAIEGSDNYVLLIDCYIDKLFKVIGELSTIKIPHEDYNFIPLEIAVDTNDIEMIVKDPINLREVIDFLKNDLINPYRKKYKEKHGEQSRIKETFVLFTDSAFNELGEHHKKDCLKYNYSKTDKMGKVRECYFYYLPFSAIEREIKIGDFLRKIKQSESDYSGALIDKIFIMPDEFDEIKSKLKSDRIVFITGTAGYGKTYTAIRLLWEYYNRGYIPEWVSGEDYGHRGKVREKLANIDTVLYSHHVIYFEDPFGITEYERRDDLKGKINFIIDSVKRKDDVYVIITSRKDVFKQFEKESYSIEEIKNFEKELNILKPSYSYNKRKEILEKWATEKECKWFKDETLKITVFKLLKNERILPTPLSIHDFVNATVKIQNRTDLFQKIDGYSEAVEMAFADEIKGMHNSGRADRVLFLSFIFVSNKLRVDFVKQEYDRLKKESYEDFEKILKEEYRIKFSDVGFQLYSSHPSYSFSHPSYSKALPYILEHKGCKNIFCDVLIELSQYDSATEDVLWIISKNYDRLPEDIRNEAIFKLFRNESLIYYAQKAIFSNFVELHENVRNRLLLRLCEKDDISDVVRIMVGFFDKLDEDIRNKLLLKISEKKITYKAASRILLHNFNKFHEEVRNESLIKFSDKHEDYRVILKIIARNFNRLPEDVRNLLFKFSEKDETAKTVAMVVAKNFDRLPENVRNLLFKFSEKDETAKIVAMVVAKNFDRLPEDVRNKLLLKFSEREETSGVVTMVMAKNFHKFSKHIRDELLFKLYENQTFIKDFNKLPKEVRNLLNLKEPL